MDYKSCVLYVYRQKKQTNSLSLRLLNPSPGELKDECLAVCRDRYDRKDENVLSTFFGRGEDKASYMRLINKREVDKFRPLERHLKGRTRNCSDTNIELLAWLIDFEWRPYKFGVDYSKLYLELDKSSSAVKDTVIIKEPEPLLTEQTITAPSGVVERQEEGANSNDGATDVQNENSDKQEVVTPDTSQYDSDGQSVDQVKSTFSISDWIKIFGFEKILNKLRSRKAVIVAILIACSGAIIILLANRNEIAYALGTQKWMYWAGDRYQLVSDSHKTPNISVIAFDQEIMDNFRRITRTDTISERSINVVYCSKKNNEYEYFTSNGRGRHPIDPFRNLKPLSRYIWERYLKPKPNLSPNPQ